MCTFGCSSDFKHNQIKSRHFVGRPDCYLQLQSNQFNSLKRIVLIPNPKFWVHYFHSCVVWLGSVDWSWNRIHTFGIWSVLVLEDCVAPVAYHSRTSHLNTDSTLPIPIEYISFLSVYIWTRLFQWIWSQDQSDYRPNMSCNCNQCSDEHLDGYLWMKAEVYQLIDIFSMSTIAYCSFPYE